jgi:hypothetical protein
MPRQNSTCESPASNCRFCVQASQRIYRSQCSICNKKFPRVALKTSRTVLFLPGAGDVAPGDEGVFGAVVAVVGACAARRIVWQCAGAAKCARRGPSRLSARGISPGADDFLKLRSPGEFLGIVEAGLRGDLAVEKDVLARPDRERFGGDRRESLCAAAARGSARTRLPRLRSSSTLTISHRYASLDSRHIPKCPS